MGSDASSNIYNLDLVLPDNSKPLGCWRDSRGDRAMPEYIRNMRDEIDWKNIHHVVETCIKEAVIQGLSYFHGYKLSKY